MEERRLVKILVKAFGGRACALLERRRGERGGERDEEKRRGCFEDPISLASLKSQSHIGFDSSIRETGGGGSMTLMMDDFFRVGASNSSSGELAQIQKKSGTRGNEAYPLQIAITDPEMF